MTGRGRGYCGSQGGPRGGNCGGMGRGRGGRGYRHQFYATGLTGWQRAAGEVPETLAHDKPPPTDLRQDELEQLRTQAEEAAATLQQLRQRIDQLTASHDFTLSEQ